MSKLVFIDTIRLSSEGNLIVGNKPGIVSLSDVSRLIGAESQADIQSFGLFERATPNYATYYPEASAEDLNPKESEFIEPVFRALSAVTIPSSYDAVNFSFDPEILNRSKSLLLGQSVMIDHETALGNIIGAVSEVSWQESYKTKGVTKPIPAGINSVLKIDGKANPRIARAVMMNPPGIHSTSVTVQFQWEKSHKVDDQTFFSKLGTYDDKGNRYMRNVVDIKKYKEISLVNHGADPYAQRLDKDGKIINPVYADISYNSEKERIVSNKHHYFSFKEFDTIKNSTTSPQEPIINNNNKPGMKKTQLLMLIAAAGLANLTTSLKDAEEDVSLTDDQINELKLAIETATTQASTMKVQVEALTADKTTLSAEVADLKAKLTAATATSSNSAEAVEALEFKAQALTSLREEVLKLSGLIDATSLTDAFKESVNKTNLQGLNLLRASLTEKFEASVPLSCQECNSTKVSRRASTSNSEDPGKSTNTPKSVQSIAEKIAQAKFSENRKNSMGLLGAE